MVCGGAGENRADMVRQGDVLLRPTTSLPRVVAAPAQDGRWVLAEGEATGHHHSVALSRGVTMFRDDGAGGGRAYVVNETAAPVSLEHQEHTALPVAPGVHEVIRQRVFTAGLAQRVTD